MMKFLFIILLFWIGRGGASLIDRKISDTIHISATKFETIFYDNYKIFTETGNQTCDLRDMIAFLTQTRNLDKVVIDDLPKAESPQECLKCRAIANTIIQFKRVEGKEQDFLKLQAQYLCKHVVRIADVVCNGLINLNTPIIEYILDNNTEVQSQDVCGIAFQHMGCAAEHSYPTFRVDLGDEVPNQRTSQQFYQSKTDPYYTRNLTIVHITDVHYDPYYNPGGNAVCHQGACCRLNQGPPANASAAAGFWGDYRECDSPWDAIVDIVHHIKSQYNQNEIAYVYFTGDIVDHFTWETTMEGNLAAMRKFHELLREEFQGIPVFPVLGNHESHPGNTYSPLSLAKEELSTQWLYDFIADDWLYWLPNSTITTIKREGYYTVLVRPGFRIITLNSNVCYGHNWWLLYNSTLFVGQLQWLHDTLHAAALDNEFVHILGHVPVNDKLCFSGWTREYRKIIEKFSYLITGQFNGHSHNDEFVVFYAKDNLEKAINVAWNGGSGTPFANLNPNYRVYKAHPITLEILNFDTWIYNLTEANLKPNSPPRWFKEYSFASRYGLADLSLKSLNSLLDRFSRDASLLKIYWQHKVKLADPELIAGCDDKCLLEQLCSIVRNDFYDTRKCEEFAEVFWANSQFLLA